MGKQINTIKILFAVHLAFACSNAMDLLCNTACGTTEEGISFQENEMCCFEDYDYEKITNGVPPHVPQLIPSWYVFQGPDGDVVALNITWVDRSSTVFTNHSDGYFLDLLGTSSFSNHRYIFRINKKAYVNSKDEPVYMSFLLFGRDDYTRVYMDKSYLVLMKSLPLSYSGQNIRKENSKKVLDMPECEDARVSQTLNCKAEEEPGLTYPPYDYEDNYPEPTFSDVKEPKVKNESSSTLLPVVIVLCGCILIVMIIGLFCLLRIRQGPLSKRKLFVVISSKECSSKSLHSQAGDVLCCCLRDIGMDVTFTLWSTTEMVTTDAIKWVNKNVAEADHVIVIQKSEHDKIITRISQDYHDGPEKESLLNPTFDPYNIIHELIRVTDDAKNKFSAVHFEEASKKYLNDIVQVQSYRLPENIIGLLRKISGRRRVPSSLKEKFEGKLANVTDKMRAKAVSQNNAMSISVPVKNLSHTESIAFLDEQPDSGYLTRQDMSLPYNDNKLNPKVSIY